MTNSIDEIEGADVILTIGSNTSESHPVLSLRVKAAVRRGAQLIVIDPRPIEMTEWSQLWLQPFPGTNVAVINGMMNHILAAGLARTEFVAARTEGLSDLADALADCTPEWAEQVSGVPAERIRAAAEAYARAGKGSILYAMGITQHTTGTDAVLSLANLALLTGQIGRESTGVNPLRGQNNVQGACDMGALCDTLPGYRKVTDPAARAALSQAWGVADLPDRPGLAATELGHAIESGRVHALYLMGENIVLTDPDSNHLRRTLTQLDFTVVQEIFLTETAAYADVILPAAAWAEKEGTFTNTERRVQRFNQALPPLGESRPDWMIIQELSTRLGYPMKHASPAEILAEAAAVTPIYGGIGHARLGQDGLQWPCPTPDHPGTPVLHRERFSRGLGRFTPVAYKPAAELPDGAFPFIFTTGRSLYHYHSGAMTRRSRLSAHLDEAYAEVDPTTAAEMGLESGDRVRLSSRRGEVEVAVRIVPGTGHRVVFMPFHFREAAANLLTNAALDPVAKIPELKVCAIRLELLEVKAV